MVAGATDSSDIDYKAVALLSSAHMADDINQGVVPAMLPFFIAAGHLTYAAAAGLVLAQTMASSVVQPLFGMIADRRPMPWLIPLGLSLAGVGVALTGLTSSYWLIFVAIALSGLGIAAFHPEAARRVRYLSRARQATTMSLFTVGGMVGFALGPLLITPTLIALGTRGAVVMAAPVLIVASVVTWQLRRITQGHPLARAGAARQAMSVAPAQWGDFSRLTIVVITRSIVFFGLNTFVPLYWIHVLQGSKNGAGLALTTFLVAVAFGTLIGGRLADTHGRRIIIVISLALVTPLLLAFVHAGSALAGGVVLLAIGLVLAASNGVVVVMAQEYLPHRIGLAAGVTLGVSMTISGLAMPPLGMIADRYGLARALTMLAILPAVGFALSLGLHETAEGVAEARTAARAAPATHRI